MSESGKKKTENCKRIQIVKKIYYVHRRRKKKPKKTNTNGSLKFVVIIVVRISLLFLSYSTRLTVMLHNDVVGVVNIFFSLLYIILRRKRVFLLILTAVLHTTNGRPTLQTLSTSCNSFTEL